MVESSLKIGRQYFAEAQLPENAGRRAIDLLEIAFKHAWVAVTQKFYEDSCNQIRLSLWGQSQGMGLLNYLKKLDPDHTVDHGSFVYEFMAKNRIADIRNQFNTLATSEELPEIRIRAAFDFMNHMKVMGLDPSNGNAFLTIGLREYDFHTNVADAYGAIADWYKERMQDDEMTSLSDKFRYARQRRRCKTTGETPADYKDNLRLLRTYSREPGFFQSLALDARALTKPILG